MPGSEDLTPEQRALVLDNMGYAENIARKVSKTLPLAEVGMAEDDCVQLGLLGLVQAARRFDASDHDLRRASVAARFRSYSYLRIKGAVVDECRRLGGPERALPPPTLSLDFESGGENLGSFEPLDGSREDWIDFQVAFRGLSRGDKEIAVQMMSGVPYTEIAPALGVSETRMYQIARDIRERLSAGMEKAERSAA